MELTKNQAVMKTLVEEMLRRNSRQDYERPPADVVLGLKVLNTMLPEGRVNIIAAHSRLGQDFAQAIGRQFRFYEDPDQIRGLSGAHFIVLHTGALSVVQHDRRCAMLEAIERHARQAVIWHVGEWRV